MRPNLRLHEIATELLEWLETYYSPNDVPCVEVAYANYSESLCIGECVIWESENGGELGELSLELDTRNAIEAYKVYVRRLRTVL